MFIYLLFKLDGRYLNELSIVLVDAIEDGDGVLTYEFPLAFISFVGIDTSLSSSDMLLASD